MLRKYRVLCNKAKLLEKSIYSGDETIYVGYIGRCNFGDDLLLDIYRKIHNKDVLPVLDKFFFQKLPSRSTVLGGGTIIGGDIYSRALKDLCLKPKQVFCAGVIPGKISREWKWLLQEAEIYTRSEESKEIIEKLGLPAVAYVDPAVFCSLVYPQITPPSKGDDLVIGVHGHYPYLSDIEYLILLASNVGLDLTFFASSPDDSRLALALNKKYGGKVVYGWKNIEYSLSVIAKARVVFTTRLHPGICATSYGTPIGFLAYDRKHEEFANSINSPNLLLKGHKDIEGFLQNALSQGSQLIHSVELWHESFENFSNIFSR